MPLLFFILWIVFNGKVTQEIVLFGIGITAAVTYLSYRTIGYTPERDLMFLRNFPLFVRYVIVLIIEIIKSALAVIRYALNPGRKPEPVIVEVHSGLNTNQQNVLLANSITLTPGTYTLFQEGDHFVVHCLCEEFSGGMGDSAFVKLLAKMEMSVTPKKRKDNKDIKNSKDVRNSEETADDR